MSSTSRLTSFIQFQQLYEIESFSIIRLDGGLVAIIAICLKCWFSLGIHSTSFLFCRSFALFGAARSSTLRPSQLVRIANRSLFWKPGNESFKAFPYQRHYSGTRIHDSLPSARCGIVCVLSFFKLADGDRCPRKKRFRYERRLKLCWLNEWNSPFLARWLRPYLLYLFLCVG